MTSTPPLPDPPGQVHVEQHDVGLLGPDDGDRGVDVGRLTDELAHRDPARGHRVGQLGPHAGAEHPVVVDEHHPHGAGPPRLHRSWSGWLMTFLLRSVAAGAPPRFRRRGGAPAPCRRAAPSCPRIDCRTPSRSSGTASRSKPSPRSRTNASTPVGPDLDVGRDRRAAVPHRVEQGLAHGLGQRRTVRLVGTVPGDDEVDRHAVQVLDVVRDLGDRGGERRLRALRPGVQPRAQLALLGAGEPGDGGGVVATGAG